MTSLVSASQVVTGQVQSLDSVRAHALPSDAMIFASATKVQPANQNPGSFSLVESANALTLTTTGSVPVVTQSPFADLYKEGSLYFNGTTGNYVSATATGLAGTQWNTTGLTIEAWVNYPTFTNASVPYTLGLIEPTLVGLMSATGSGASTPFSNVSFGVNTTGNVLFWYNTTAVGQYTVTSYTQLSTNTWNHIAVSIAPAGFVYLFVNGVQSQIQENRNGTAIGAYYYGVVQGTPSTASSNPLVIGQFNQVAGTVYVADLRITTGAGIYTGSASSYATFTVPSAPLSPYTTGGAVGQALIRAGQNSPTIQSGALTFDRGLKQFMNFGAATFNIVTQGFTAVWRGAFTGTPASYERLFEIGVARINTSTGASITVYRNALTGVFQFALYPTNSATPATTVNTSTLNQSINYVLTFRYSPVTQTADIWVNGLYNNSASCTTTSLVADRSATFTYLGYASDSGVTTSETSNTLAIYNRALSNVEILNAYSALTTNTINAPIEIGDSNGTPALSIAGDGRVNVTKLGQTSNVLPWPPAAMTGYVTSINGQTYVASDSSEYSANYGWYSFGVPGSGTNWVAVNGVYSGTSPFPYIGSATTTDTQGTVYPGEWLQIQLPSPVTLSSYKIVPTTDGSANLQSPVKWVLLGSKDGVNWFLVDSRSGQTSLAVGTTTTYTTSTPMQSFNYYRLSVNQVAGNGAGLMSINNLTLYGTADTAQTLTVAQPMTLSYGAQTASLTGLVNTSVFTPQDFSSSGLNIPAYVVSNTATVANTVAFSSFGPFAGEGSVYFPGGTGAYVNFPSSAVTLWPGGATSLSDGTVEAWVYLTQYNASNSMIFMRTPSTSSSTTDWYFNVNSSGNLVLTFVNSGSTPYTATGGTVPLNTWTHVAGSVATNVVRIFVNGTVTTGQTFSGTLIGSATDPLLMSSYTLSASQNIKGGYVACARAVAGQALYVGSFTPPTGPLPPLQGVTQAGLPYGTVLLLRNAPAPGRVLTSKFGGANSGGVNGAPLTLAFPPAAMTTYAVSLNSGYGQGTYVASASSEYSGNPAWKGFSKAVVNGWSPANGQYTSTTPGVYQYSNATVDVTGTAYLGEWLQMQMPSSVTLANYVITSYSNAPNGIYKWWLLGSRDGTSWYLVDSRSNVTWASPWIQTFSVASSQAFNYFRVVVSQVGGPGGANPVIADITLNGTIEGPNVTADGRLGLGVSNPVQALEVAGSAVVAGTLSAGNPLMFRNRIINGDMRVFQRGTTFSLSGASSVYTLDRWQQYTASGGTRTVSNVVDVPFRSGFVSSANVVSTATATTTTEFMINQSIEMYNVIDLIGSPVTVSFWYKSNRTGNHGVRFNSGGTIPGNSDTFQTFTVFNANTWEYKVLTFNTLIQCTVPGPSTWNGLGIALNIGPVVYNMGSTSIANGDYFTLTGVQLEKGSLATPFEVRPYAVELQLCQRYYEQSYEIGTVPGTTTNTGICLFSCSSDGNPRAYATVRYAVPKRSAVTPTFYTQTGTAGSWNYYQNGTSSTSALSIYGGSTMATTSFSVYQNVTNAWAACNVVGHWVANAEL